METDTRVTEGGATYIEVIAPDYLSLEGKTCTQPNCYHKAHCVWTWAPGHFSGYRCICCLRAIWQETLRDVQEGLEGLPEGCDA